MIGIVFSPISKYTTTSTQSGPTRSTSTIPSGPHAFNTTSSNSTLSTFPGSSFPLPPFLPLFLLGALWTLALSQFFWNNLSSPPGPTSFVGRRILATQRPKLWQAWKTKNYRILFGLCQLYNDGRLPWGPWDASSVQDLGVEGKGQEKDYLRGLSLMGVILLYIQDAGLGTRRLEGSKTWRWSNGGEGWIPLPPLWVQSKRRAFIDFVMPLPPHILPQNPAEDEHFMEQDEERIAFLSILGRVAEDTNCFFKFIVPTYRNSESLEDSTAAPLEYGATSKFLAWLPFKRDRVIRPATGRESDTPLLDTYMKVREPDAVYQARRRIGAPQSSEYRVECPLLVHNPYAICRLENRGGEEEPNLLEMIAKAAIMAGMGDLYDIGEIRSITKAWLVGNGLGELPGLEGTMWDPRAADGEFEVESKD